MAKTKTSRIDELAEQMEIAKRAAANNAAFAKLSKAQKCVAVAKDVIEQIKLEKYQAKQQVYVNFLEVPASYPGLDDYNYIPVSSDQFQEATLHDKTVCQCCGIGGCLLSMVRLGNSVSLEDAAEVDDQDFITKQLSKIMSRRQIRMIELAFEEEGHADFSDTINNRCIVFGQQFKSDSERLIGIMKNIIANKGEFIP
jgi:hypothetical protein